MDLYTQEQLDSYTDNNEYNWKDGLTELEQEERIERLERLLPYSFAFCPTCVKKYWEGNNDALNADSWNKAHKPLDLLFSEKGEPSLKCSNCGFEMSEEDFDCLKDGDLEDE